MVGELQRVDYLGSVSSRLREGSKKIVHGHVSIAASNNADSFDVPLDRSDVPVGERTIIVNDRRNIGFKSQQGLGRGKKHKDVLMAGQSVDFSSGGRIAA